MNALVFPSLFTCNILVVTGTLEVCSPLVLGSGKRQKEADLKKDGNEPEASQLVEDHEGKPFIPGSSLKGIMRRLAAGAPAIDELFGKEPKNNADATMGSVMVYGAECVSTSLPLASHLPYYDKAKGSGINARTAIQAAKGVADKSKLFHERQVPKGVTFDWRLELTLGNASAERLLGQVLGMMMEGFALGRGTGSGQGHLKLLSPHLQVEGITATGDWGHVSFAHQVNITPSVATRRGSIIELKLTCDGPYLVNDPSWDKKLKAIPKEERKKKPKLKALGMAEALPPEAILPGTSLKGVLRSRSAWLEACKYGDSTELTNLLFGDTDRAALLRIDEISAKHQGEVTLESVKLDRFSGAPIEKALFSCRCFVNPTFNVKLCFEEARVLPDKLSRLNDHLDELKKNIVEDGLMVGMGGNRGFGWCKVEVVP
jgi:hypothetical protein